MRSLLRTVKLESVSDVPGPLSVSKLESDKWKASPMVAIQRFVGLDVHRRTVTVAAVDAQQNVVLPPREISIQRFFSWAQTHLQAADRVALEATSNAWDFYDQLVTWVAEV